MRGSLRTSRTRGGMRWTRKARETHALDAYGEVAWFGRRGAGAKLAIRSASDGGKRAVLREEHEVSRKAIAQGRPGCSRRTCMLVCASPPLLAHGTAGAARTRSSLRPLNSWRASEMQTSGESRRENAASFSVFAMLTGLLTQVQAAGELL